MFRSKQHQAPPPAPPSGGGNGPIWPPRNPAFDIPHQRKRGSCRMHVTPEIAREWLKYNTHNQAIDWKLVERYAEDMRSGDWGDSGAPIRFAPEFLMDGQKRLAACQMADVSFTADVFYGMDPEQQVNMDNGGVRRAKEVLMIEGLSRWQATTAASAIHPLISLARGRGLQSAERYGNRHVRNFYLEHKRALDASIALAESMPRRHPVIPLYIVLALHYVFSAKTDTGAADGFMRALCTGDGVALKTPLGHARSLFLSDALAGRKRTRLDTMAKVIHTWNATVHHRRAQTPAFLRPANHAFPEVSP